MSEKKLTFNIAYYAAFQNVRSIMEELYIFLTPNKEHKKLFPDVPVVGFTITKVNIEHSRKITKSSLETFSRSLLS